MLKENDLLKAQKALMDLKQPLTITVFYEDEDDYSKKMINMARQLTGISNGTLHLHYGNVLNLPGLPAFTAGCGPISNLIYLAIPEGPELEVFLKALAYMDKGHGLMSEDSLEHLEQIKSPAEIKVLISPTCPHCPKVVHNAVSLAATNPLIKVLVIDVEHFTDVARIYNAKAAPTTIIDDYLCYVGQISAEELAFDISQRGTNRYIAKTLKSLLGNGRVADAVMIIIKLDNMEAIMPLYLSEEISTRISILMALEEVLEFSADSLDRFVPELIAILGHEDYRIRGDTADLLGKVGAESALQPLEQLLQDENQEVVEAAAEAIETIKNKRE